MTGEPGGRRWRRGLILGGVLAAGLTLVGLAAAGQSQRARRQAGAQRPGPRRDLRQGRQSQGRQQDLGPRLQVQGPAPHQGGRARPRPEGLLVSLVSGHQPAPRSRTPSSPTSSWSRTTSTPSITIRCCPRCRTPSARSRTRPATSTSRTPSRSPPSRSRRRARTPTPKAVTGVAIWDDVDPDSNNYSIFVAGLSNGWSQTDNPISPDKEPIVRRKTLQLDFKRLGDRYNMTSEEIHFVGPYKWIYRASELNAGQPDAGQAGGQGQVDKGAKHTVRSSDGS